MRLVIAIAALAALLSCRPCAAQQPAAAPSKEVRTAVAIPDQGWDASYTAGYYSRYFAKVSGVTFYPKPVLQHSLTLSRKGTSFNVWQSYSGAGGPDADFGDEVDFTVDHAFTLGKAGSVSMDIGLATYQIVPLRRRNDYWAPFMRVAAARGKVRPFGYAEYDFADKGPGALLYKVGVDTSYKSLNVTASLGGHGSSFGWPARPLSYGQVMLSRNFPLSKHLTVMPLAVTQHRFGGRDLAETMRLTFGCELRYH